MASVTGYTAARMKQIEDSTVVGGHVNENGDLILERFDGQFLTGGHVAGQDGTPGTQGPPGVADQEVLDDIYENIDNNQNKIEEVTLTPKAPTNLFIVQNSAAFQLDGRVKCSVYLMWDLVVSSVDEKPIGAVEYQIWARTGTDVARPLISGNRDAEIVIDIWPPAQTYYVSVRAKSVNGTVWSDLSAEIPVTTVVPSQSSAVTVAPTLTSNLGLVFVNWNGTFFDSSVPNGVRHILTEYEISGSDVWKSVGTPATDNGQVAVIREAVGQDVSVRLRWVDTLGRVSAPSAEGSITVLGVGSVDISDEIIDAIEQADSKADQALAALTSSIKSISIEYALASSETVAPTTGWSTDAPARTAGTFIWTRTITTYNDDTTDTSSPVLMTGNTGSPGADGSDGADGTNGEDGAPGEPGRGIASTTVTYQVGTSGTVAPTGTWQSTPQATTVGKYLWTRTVTTWTDSTNTTSYSVAAHGATGSKGATGSAGKGLTSSAITYQVSTSGTTTPTGTWTTSVPTVPAGQYLWTRTILTWSDSSTSTAYSVARTGTNGTNGSDGSDGVDGEDGAPGKGVSNVTPYFLSVGSGSAAPAKPATNPPGGSWSLTEPGYISSTDLYRTELVVYSDNSFTYTNVSKVSAYTAATQAVTVANLADAAAKGMVKASASDPGHQLGRIWVVLDGSGDMIGIKISNGSAWSSYTMVADQILVPSSIGTVSIADGAITTPKMVAESVTAEKLNVSEIWANEAWLNVLRAGVIEVDMVVAGFGENLNLGSNSMIELIIDGQSENSANIAAAQESADLATQAATDANEAAATAQGTANTVQENLDVTNGLLQTTTDEVENLKTWFRVDSAGAHMGRTDSSFQTHMLPDRFAITDNGVETTYWKSGVMNVTSAEVTNIILSNHQISPFDNGGTVIRAVGTV